MSVRLFTIVCDFRSGTYVSQVRASDERDAVRAWTELLIEERPIKGVSSYLAKSVASSMAEYPPVALSGLQSVWCITGSCGGDFVLANIVETVPYANA